jgi:hypothetical protein
MSTFTYEGQRPRVLLEDPRAPHQIVLTLTRSAGWITVSCTCLVRARAAAPLAAATRMDASESLAIWKAHAERASRGGI